MFPKRAIDIGRMFFKQLSIIGTCANVTKNVAEIVLLPCKLTSRPLHPRKTYVLKKTKLQPYHLRGENRL